MEEDDDESWEPRKENHNMSPTVVMTPETEENTNEGEYRILKDNQLWEKQEEAREESENRDNGEEKQADGTIKKVWVPGMYWYKPGTHTNFSLT